MPALVATALLGPLFAVAAAAHAPPPPAPESAVECAVWDREMSFARTVAAHDAVAFANHVAPDAVFGAGSPHPQRGRATIVHGWASILRGDGIRLQWYPTRTTVVGNLAWSTGPTLIEQTDGSTPRFLQGTYQSVWRRAVDGRWQVLFDAGTPPQPVDEAAAALFDKARPTACPRGS